MIKVNLELRVEWNTHYDTWWATDEMETEDEIIEYLKEQSKEYQELLELEIVKTFKITVDYETEGNVKHEMIITDKKHY